MTTLDLFSLKGRTALVTGGAGLYGRQIVRGLAEAGATTYMASRGVEALGALAAELRAEGLDVHALRLDQGDEASVLAARDEIAKQSGGLDILVNNAVARPATRAWRRKPRHGTRVSMSTRQA
ncbi:SDR family NAD(P)-dependent oxidoreductase [Tessaracoccus coleopterorum]|uniref:SDR family NAD(P)-dependent oxidoreductase n=1 Tax=Tessaracoccus coleopterorum TaxID=2714950 RepID=UPI0018D46CA8|nr:SDR family NAD(P)-dependent oxidoreductase [Tessaracoccus coleopterorum]